MGKKNLALVGGVLALPAFILVSFGLAQSWLGIHQFNDALDSLFANVREMKIFLHPAILIGGLLVALVLNAKPVLKFTFVPEDGTFIGVVRMKDRMLNLAMILVAGLLLATILAYAVAENFTVAIR